MVDERLEQAKQQIEADFRAWAGDDLLAALGHILDEAADAVSRCHGLLQHWSDPETWEAMVRRNTGQEVPAGQWHMELRRVDDRVVRAWLQLKQLIEHGVELLVVTPAGVSAGAWVESVLADLAQAVAVSNIPFDRLTRGDVDSLSRTSGRLWESMELVKRRRSIATDAENKGKPPRKSRRRQRSTPGTPKSLTPRQTEVVQVVGECKGNIAGAARRLGRDRKTIDEAYRAAMEKLGKQVYQRRDKTRLLTRDKRSQEDIADIDDSRREGADEDLQRRHRRR
jgi:DNA-binding NarL/FixJ family response regulator